MRFTNSPITKIKDPNSRGRTAKFGAGECTRCLENF